MIRIKLGDWQSNRPMATGDMLHFGLGWTPPAAFEVGFVPLALWSYLPWRLNNFKVHAGASPSPYRRHAAGVLGRTLLGLLGNAARDYADSRRSDSPTRFSAQNGLDAESLRDARARSLTILSIVESSRSEHSLLE